MIRKRVLALLQEDGDLAKNPVRKIQGRDVDQGKVIPPKTPSSRLPQAPSCDELKIERLYEKTETTQTAPKSQGHQTLDTIKGARSSSDDARVVQHRRDKGADFDNMKDGFKKDLNGHRQLQHHFGGIPLRRAGDRVDKG